MPSLWGLGSASDNADTLPQDIRTVPPPHDKTPEWTSPELSAQTKRAKYQVTKKADKEEKKESSQNVEKKKIHGAPAQKPKPSQKVAQMEEEEEKATDKVTESDAEAR